MSTIAHTFTTPSHRRLLTEHFLPSWVETQTMPLEVYAFPQECASGAFMEAGWNSTMRRKVRLILDALYAGKPFWHLDCDIRFFRQLPEAWPADMVLQRDREGPCAGLFWCRPSVATKSIWEEVAQLLDEGKAANDQTALWQAIREHPDAKVCFLPPTFWTHGAETGRLYAGDDAYILGDEVPVGIVAHHANYCVGVEAKDRLLREVASVVHGRRAVKEAHR